MIEKMASMKQTLAGLLEQLRQWESRHAELREKSLALFAENEILKSVRGDFHAARERIENLETELAGLRAQEATLKEQVEERRKREAELVRDLDTVRESLKESRHLVEKREAELASEITRAAESRGEAEGRIATLEARIAAIEEARAELETREARHLEKLNRLERENGALKGEAEEAARMIEELAGGFQQLDTSFAQMQGELAASRPDGEKMPSFAALPGISDEEIARLRGMIEERDRRVLALEKELERARGLVPQDMRFKLDTLRRENEELLARAETAERERAKSADQAARWKADLEALERREDGSAALSAERDRLAREVADLKEKTKRTAGDAGDALRVTQLTDRLVARDNEIALLREHASAAETERAELEAERDDLKNQVRAILGEGRLAEFLPPDEARNLRAELADARARLADGPGGGAKAAAFDAIRAAVADYAARSSAVDKDSDDALTPIIESFQRIVETVERFESGEPPASGGESPAAIPAAPAAATTATAAAPAAADPTFWEGKPVASPGSGKASAAPVADDAPPVAREALASEVDALLGDVESTYKELFGE